MIVKVLCHEIYIVSKLSILTPRCTYVRVKLFLKNINRKAIKRYFRYIGYCAHLWPDVSYFVLLNPSSAYLIFDLVSQCMHGKNLVHHQKSLFDAVFVP